MRRSVAPAQWEEPIDKWLTSLRAGRAADATVKVRCGQLKQFARAHAHLAAILILLASGCAATPVEPTETEPVEVTTAPLYERTATDADVAKFLENTYDTLPEQYKSAELRADVINLGHTFCERAAEFGTTTGEEATLHINDLDKSDPVYMYNMSLALLVGAKSGEIFCPDFAAEPAS